MWSWWIASNYSKKCQIYPRQCIQSNEGNIYKNWKAKILLVLDSSEDIPNFNNHEISESNIKFDVCTTQLCGDMSKQWAIERTKCSSEGPRLNWQWTWRFHICSLQQIYKETDRLIIRGTWWRNCIIRIWYFFYWTERKLYIDKTFWANVYWFWLYTAYSSAISENFETDANANIQCDCGYSYSSIKENNCPWINEKVGRSCNIFSWC